MKSTLKRIGFAVILVAGLYSNAYSHCVGLHPHHCSPSGIIGGIHHELDSFAGHLEALGGGVKDFAYDPVSEGVQIWHQYYGQIPGWARETLNQWGPTIIGYAAYDLSGAAFARYVQMLYYDFEDGVRHVADARELGLSVDREQALEEFTAFVITMRNTLGGETKKAGSSQNLRISDLKEEYYERIKFAPTDA